MMTDSVPVMSAATVRQHVLDQHAVLRDLLNRVLETTTLTLRGDVDSASALDAIVRELRTRFRAHLAYEERYLVPFLAEADVWGPQRVANLLREHVCQRAELDTLLEGIDTDWDPERLALAARSLVTDLLRDMEEEESGTLSASLLRDDVVNVEQATD